MGLRIAILVAIGCLNVPVLAQQPFLSSTLTGEGHVYAHYDIRRGESVVCGHDPSEDLRGIIPGFWLATTKPSVLCSDEGLGGASAQSLAEAEGGCLLDPSNHVFDTAGLSATASLLVEGQRTDSVQTTYAVNTQACAKLKGDAVFDVNAGWAGLDLADRLVFVTGVIVLQSGPSNNQSSSVSPEWGTFIRCEAGDSQLTAVFMGTYWVIFGEVTKKLGTGLTTENVFEIVNDVHLNETFKFAEVVTTGEGNGVPATVEIGGTAPEGGEAKLNHSSVGSDQDYSIEWDFWGQVDFDFLIIPVPLEDVA